MSIRPEEAAFLLFLRKNSLKYPAEVREVFSRLPPSSLNATPDEWGILHKLREHKRLDNGEWQDAIWIAYRDAYLDKLGLVMPETEPGSSSDDVGQNGSSAFLPPYQAGLDLTLLVLYAFLRRCLYEQSLPLEESPISESGPTRRVAATVVLG